MTKTLPKTQSDRRWKGPRVQWNQELRLGLHLLNSVFNFNGHQKVAIFCVIFKDHLQRCGDPEVTVGKLSIQYGEKQKPSTKHHWAFCDDNSLEATLERDALKGKIESAAQQLTSANAPVGPSHRALATPTHLGSPKSPQPKQTVLDLHEFVYEPITPSTALKQRRIVEAVDPDTRVVQRTPLTIPTVARAVKSAKSPKTPKSPRRLDATIRHQIRFGEGVLLTPQEKFETTLPLVYPPEDKAHPNLTGLLYRLWDEDSQSPLTSDGFLAGSFKAMPTIDPPPPPTAEAPMWNAMATHLNQDEVDTPFISTSMSLVWIIRLAVKVTQYGKTDKNISIIDPGKISRQKVFHAQPFHDALKKKRCFTKAAFMYHGQFEVLTYHQIPAEAIIKTFKFSDIITLTSRLPEVSALLRLQQIVIPRKGYLRSILPTLRAQNVTLTPPAIRSMANVAKFLGLRYTSSLGHISGVGKVPHPYSSLSAY
jgi:hypothetical protein